MAPAEDLLPFGSAGERFVAALRIPLILCITYLVLGGTREGLRGLAAEGVLVGVLALGLVGSVLILIALRPAAAMRSFPFLTGVFDVSLVTAALAVSPMTESSPGGVHFLLIFPFYLLAIAASSLRCDPRVSLVTGVVAIVQQGFLVDMLLRGSGAHGSLSSFGVASIGAPDAQAGRLALLVATTIVAIALSARTGQVRLLFAERRLEAAKAGHLSQRTGVDLETQAGGIAEVPPASDPESELLPRPDYSWDQPEEQDLGLPN